MRSATQAARESKTSRAGPSVVEMQARIDALEAELAAARERETATAEMLGVINASPGKSYPSV